VCVTHVCIALKSREKNAIVMDDIDVMGRREKNNMVTICNSVMEIGWP